MIKIKRRILQMKRYVTFILCLLLILIITSCTPPIPSGPVYWGKLYNACDGTCGCSGWTLDFYIDNSFIATIKPGKNYSTAVTAGWHVFKVRHNQEVITGSVVNSEITVDGWWYVCCCEDGTYPKDIGYKSTGDNVISSYFGYIR